MMALPAPKEEKKTEHILSFRKKARMYLKKNGYTVLQIEKSIIPDTYPKIFLDNTQNLKNALVSAKKEGINKIFEETKFFTENGLELLGLLNETFELEPRKNSFLERITTDGRIVSQVSYSWIQNGIQYLFLKKTFHFTDAKEILWEIHEQDMKRGVMFGVFHR